ncbi:MAG: DUF5702 domain-containing protein [Eubacterium sp.]|nr:DUF5702 domain-containing protein [Eubacterium sp.]
MRTECVKERKNNSGVITIFLTLVLVVLFSLFLVVIRTLRIRNARIYASTALRSAVSGIKADYNPYIFENYHVLLFDSTYYGRGEGYTEEKIKESLEYTLGSEYEVKDVVISGLNTIQKNKCQALKNQINDYMKYSLAGKAVDYLIEKVGVSPEKADKPLSDDAVKNMDKEAVDALKHDDDEIDHEEEKKSKKKNEKKDPRFLNKFMGTGMVAIMMLPEDAEFSSNIIDITEMPSFSDLYSIFKEDDIDNEFQDYGNLRGSLTSSERWGNGLTDEAAAICYCSEVFKSLRQKSDKETFVNLEKEYLICGYYNDYMNYTQTVKKLIKLRLGFNFAYILTDAGKMARLSSLATVLTAYAPFLQPVVKYLLAGCWSYIESYADVNYLVKGHKVKLIKSAEDWTTDLYDLTNVFSKEMSNEDEEKGLTYDEYLMILMACTGDILYDRILDLYEVNAKMKYPEFRIKNAAVEFSVNTVIEFDGIDIDLYKETGY